LSLRIKNNETETACCVSEIWRESLRIHSYDVDFAKRATPVALCRAFLEAAWNHAEKLGFGYAELASQNKLWVLARLLVQIDVYPLWGEIVELTTWPRGISGAFALRDFEICATGGRRLAAGASSWLVLDCETHRPQRIDKLILRIPSPRNDSVVGRDPKKLGSIENGGVAFATAVLYSDIDVNRHVNSARYIGWLLDAYSWEFHQCHTLKTLELNYVGESQWNDSLTVLSGQRAQMEFAHSIVKSDQTEVCRAELLWDGGPTPKPASS
jgi:acyl-ACP thioesterase